LKEQKFQTSGSVNKNTAVQVGKILGVSYLLVGDVYVLNDDLVINARLTDAESGNIVFSKKQEGKTLSWLKLKTEIAKQLASQFSLPFTEPVMPDQQFALATLTTFGNAVAATDNGDFKKAEELSTTVKDFSPDFKYIEDLSKDIESLKSRVANVEKNVLSLKDAISNLKNIYFDDPKTEAQFLSNAYLDYNNGRYAMAIKNFKRYFSFGSNYIDPYLDFFSIFNLPKFSSEKKEFQFTL
jgi:tetratricopeptide (TPR) repeat protein